ncbi:hypothetical protein ACWEKM_24660 [Streptomyces sp. NPDC004752]
MDIAYCTTCIGFAASWNSVKDTAGALAAVERESVQALFGLHLASHVEAETPPLVQDCPGCGRLGSYIASHGEDSVAPGGCSETAGQLLRQHLLGHLLPCMPTPS